MKKTFGIRVSTVLFGIAFCLVLGLQIKAQNGNDVQTNPPDSRDIVPEFETVRPKAASSGDIQIGGSVFAVKKTAKQSYKRISQRPNSGKIERADKPKRRAQKINIDSNIGKKTQTNVVNRTNNQKNAKTAKTVKTDLPVNRSQQIGLTLWRLSPTTAANTVEGGEDLPFTGTAGAQFLTPTRVSLDTLFETGDYVRLSLETTRRGYIYVVDQEMYADGSLGDAFLVFPNKRIRNGANIVAPGKPVELPDLKGNPFYFELRPQNSNGKAIISEVLSVIVTEKPIAGLNTGENPVLITPAKLAGWRSKYAGRAEIFERESITTKQGYSKAERDAANGSVTLTNSDSLPNTIYMVENKSTSGGVLITVPLWYGKD
ncbi:MAG: DUF4384 domain-containing protein [Pyrinomonadaceae bacterium]|nr:DUF4384 domain-containing protein [Pyrinomonadaceae bacterium]